MNSIMEKLNQVSSRLSDPDFLSNKGLSNEVGIHVFCYEAAEQQVVTEYFDRLKQRSDVLFRIVERDIYEIFLMICEEKRILSSIPAMEERKGKDFLLEQLCKIATPEAFVEKMRYEPQMYGDILLITGIDKAYPFIRVHSILDNIQHIFEKIPVLLLYPGVYNGQNLSLFGKFPDGNYYRAFNLL